MIETVALEAGSYDPSEIIQTLAEEGCEFVVVGGVAATLLGSPLLTTDFDMLARRTRDNRTRLAASLVRLEARPLLSIDWLSDAATVVNQPVDAALLGDLDPGRLLTKCGVVDIMWRDEAVGDWAAWNASATDLELAGHVIRIAAVDDLIASKERADRDKDRAALPFLREILRRRDAGD